MKRSKFEIRRNADFQLILCVLLLVVDSLKLTCKSIQKHTKHRQHHFRLCSKIKDSEMAKVTRKWIIFHFVEFAAKHKAISDAFRTMLELLTMATDFCWRSTTSNFIFWRHIKANRCTRNFGINILRFRTHLKRFIDFQRIKMSNSNACNHFPLTWRRFIRNIRREFNLIVFCVRNAIHP